MVARPPVDMATMATIPMRVRPTVTTGRAGLLVAYSLVRVPGFAVSGVGRGVGDVPVGVGVVRVGVALAGVVLAGTDVASLLADLDGAAAAFGAGFTVAGLMEEASTVAEGSTEVEAASMAVVDIAKPVWISCSRKWLTARRSQPFHFLIF